jgi:hypothetical protein
MINDCVMQWGLVGVADIKSVSNSISEFMSGVWEWRLFRDGCETTTGGWHILGIRVRFAHVIDSVIAPCGRVITRSLTSHADVE